MLSTAWQVIAKHYSNSGGRSPTLWYDLVHNMSGYLRLIINTDYYGYIDYVFIRIKDLYGLIIRRRSGPPVDRPKDPRPRVLSLPSGLLETPPRWHSTCEIHMLEIHVRIKMTTFTVHHH